MATKNQVPEGKIQANLVVNNEVHKAVKDAASDMKMSISEIYAQGAMTLLNNGRRPISQEEMFARNILHDVPREKWVYMEATGKFLAGSISQSRLAMLRTALGQYFDEAQSGPTKKKALTFLNGSKLMDRNESFSANGIP